MNCLATRGPATEASESRVRQSSNSVLVRPVFVPTSNQLLVAFIVDDILTTRCRLIVPGKLSQPNTLQITLSEMCPTLTCHTTRLSDDHCEARTQCSVLMMYFRRSTAVHTIGSQVPTGPKLTKGTRIGLVNARGVTCAGRFTVCTARVVNGGRSPCSSTSCSSYTELTWHSSDGAQARRSSCEMTCH